MTLHPIIALDQVIVEYQDYLRTEFRAKNPALKEALAPVIGVVLQQAGAEGAEGMRDARGSGKSSN